jgi:short-subunit dehydrogenase
MSLLLVARVVLALPLPVALQFKALELSSLRREETLAQALSQFQANDLQTVKGLILDLTILTDAGAVFNQASDLLGEPVDILVNNAGISAPTSLADSDLTDIHRVFQVNLIAPILLSQAFAAQFVSDKMILAVLSISVPSLLNLMKHIILSMVSVRQG